MNPVWCQAKDIKCGNRVLVENRLVCFKFLSATVFDILYRFELALQQNEIMDVFFDDWAVLGEEDTNFGSKSDGHLKVSTTFVWKNIV